MKKNIGLFGFDQKKFLLIKKKFKSCNFYNLSDFNKSYVEFNAFIAYSQDSFEKFFLKEKFKIYKNLEWVHVSIAGVDEYIKYFNDFKFKFTCGKKIQGTNVSDHGMALLLSLTRNLNNLSKKIKPNKFRRPIDLYEKKCLIFGLGSIGLGLASKCNAFGMKVSSIDLKYKSEISFLENQYLFKDLNRVINEFDIVFIATPLTSKTEHLFNKNIFKKMKNKSFLINITRGDIIKTPDLIKYIKANKFAGVGLDVIENEPLKSNNEIFNYDNVIYTHHTAGMSDNFDKRFKLIIDNIENYILGEDLINVVDLKNEY